MVGNQHRVIFVALLLATVVLFWLVPPFSSSAWPTSTLVEGSDSWRAEHPAPQRFFVSTGLVVPKPGGFGFGSLATVLQNWWPLVWPMLLAIHAIGLSIWAAGWAWARYQNRATS
jgi:hypothetical protein